MRKPDQRSAEAAAYRKLYRSARWIRLREWHKSHHPLCVYCLEREVVSEVEVVDHIKPHRGDTELFWDPGNLQSLCAACHNSRKQREDLGLIVPGVDASGWPEWRDGR